MRVTLDTNIYVSALQFGGKPMQLLQMGLEGELDIAISQPILDETLRVLRENFGWSDEDLRDAEAAISAATYRVAPTETLDVVEADPTDNRILECAVAVIVRAHRQRRPTSAGAESVSAESACSG